MHTGEAAGETGGRGERGAIFISCECECQLDCEFVWVGLGLAHDGWSVWVSGVVSCQG